MRQRSWALSLFCFSLAAGGTRAFEFNAETSCVLFNSDNTDILTTPADCSLEANIPWCNCVRTILTNPRPGQATAVEQGVIWIRGQPGIGNFRTEVQSGTLDISTLQTGDVIGGTLIHDLVPESVGVPPGTFFTSRGEIRVTSNDETRVGFEVVLVELSPIVLPILRYNPLDDAHSNGVLYQGVLVPLGPGKGFTFEYRYETAPGATFPAIQANDADSPGFNVRNAFSLFTDGTDGAGVFTLPPDGPLNLHTTMRKFTASGNQVADPAEILPLGEADLCAVVVEPIPCREFDESLEFLTSPVNQTPNAAIVVTDAQTLATIPDPVHLFIDCGEGRAILRGSNSDDGDGGTQGLAYRWDVVEGPEGGAVIPQETVEFRDTEISFHLTGTYRVRLIVDDGQPLNNTDSDEVTIFVDEGAGPNLPPEVTIRSEPDPAVVGLENGTAKVKLIASGTTGADGCFQSLTYSWAMASGPAEVSFDSIGQDDTNVTFNAAGEYVIRVTVDDGAPADSSATAEITVQVGRQFQRCDSNADGINDLSDAIFSLTFMFVGGEPAKCAASLDCNSDGVGDISDAVFNLTYLFLAGEAPAAPYPGCDLAAGDCGESTPCSP